MKPSTLTYQNYLEIIFQAAFAFECFSFYEARSVSAVLKLIRTGDGCALLQQDGHGAAYQEKQLVTSLNVTKPCTYISAKGREEVSEQHGVAFGISYREIY